MNRRVGQGIYGAAVVCFGATSIVMGSVVAGLEPVPAAFPMRTALGYATGAILVTTGLAILANVRAKIAAIMLGAFLVLWMLVLHVPQLVQHPTSGQAWTQASELLGILGVALVLASDLPEHGVGAVSSDDAFVRLGTAGRLCIALALPIYGILHFVYATLVAGMVPAWIPSRLFLAYAVGVAFCAAGVSIATRIHARLAAWITGMMFGIWVVVLHIPRVAASRNEAEFTSMMVALAMCGGGFVLAQHVMTEIP